MLDEFHPSLSFISIALLRSISCIVSAVPCIRAISFFHLSHDGARVLQGTTTASTKLRVRGRAEALFESAGKTLEAAVSAGSSELCVLGAPRRQLRDPWGMSRETKK